VENIDPNSTLVLESGKPLEDELWFHGVLPRGEVVRLLVKVRFSS